MPTGPDCKKATPVIILTGLCGAGKSTAIKVFEDLGFFAVDGLPPQFISQTVSLLLKLKQPQYKGIAIGLGSQADAFATSWQTIVDELEKAGATPQIIFIECSEAVLARRYAATRRPHPMEGEHGLAHALTKERELLWPLKENADLIIDTTSYSIHDLRRILQEKWDFITDKKWGLRVYVLSFGFKHATPADADMVFDLRFLPNPYFEKHLSALDGRNKSVARFVLACEPGKNFLKKQLEYLHFILPLYAQEGRYRITCAFGCTGGRHRSVATAEAVFESLHNAGYAVFLEHRHLDL